MLKVKTSGISSTEQWCPPIDGPVFSLARRRTFASDIDVMNLARFRILDQLLQIAAQSLETPPGFGSW